MPSESQEFNIPVPYGHLAAKAWGDPASASNNVLALHGWRNNAGTFDNLAPLLSEDLYIVAVDLSGHGLSSHKPLGCSYNYIEYVMDVCRIVDILKWQKFSIIGHSFGCCVGMMYASMYTNRVECIIALDLYSPLHVQDKNIARYTSESIRKVLSIEEKLGFPPTYLEDELIDKLDAATFGKLTESSKRTLLKRDLTPVGAGKVTLNPDPRTKIISTIHFNLSFQYALMEHYTGDLLMVTASEIDPRIMRESMDAFFDLYSKKCRRFKHVEVEGNHFVHLNNAERVAPVVNAFLQEMEYNS
ncbi:serine hydrolase-like protein isoform X2 [Ornithodoros turicata]